MAIECYPDPTQAAEGCARHILRALEDKPRASLAISGGSSPRIMFEIFAKTQFLWERVQLFWVDERAVPPDDEQSNFKLANDHWLIPGKFPLGNIHRIPAELPPQAAAERYTADIRATFDLGPDRLPEFDVIHQGMGPDGHTASLFPGEPLIEDRTRVAAAVWVEKFKQWRITLLPGVLLNAKNTVMLVTGNDKAQALHAVLHGPSDVLKYPAQLIAREARAVNWFLEQSLAASAGE
jgi:6-phosphogluconolactonase